METIQQFFPNYYRDSVALMQLSAKAANISGVIAVSAQMATAANIQLMVDAKLLAQALPAKPNDLLLVVQADTPASAQEALDFVTRTLDESSGTSVNGSVNEEPSRSLAMGLKVLPEANLALISTPGDFAAGEAMKALKLGLNVMMFSDNVTVEQEIALKQYARDHDLLVMGPDCGTAIIQSIPLAFANVVRAGKIGIIGASGTGIQQVSCLIDQQGEGISHAIGTGGHDLSEAVGGITMLSALKLLANDPATEVIVLISKPPAPSVAQKVIAAAQSIQKPVVINFLGSNEQPATKGSNQIYWAKTLESAAYLAIDALKQSAQSQSINSHTRIAEFKSIVAQNIARLQPTQTCVRGLYTGGTFCYEAQLLLQPILGQCYSNTPTKQVQKLANIWQSEGHTIIDLGDDDFTRGKPHPMIDPSTRNERILQEARDPNTAVILVDLVLGYGAHEDPAAELAKVMQKANEIARTNGRVLFFVGFICGTHSDPQNYQQQAKLLTESGLLLAQSNAHATEIVASIMHAIKGA